MVKLRGASGRYLVAASQFRDALKLFTLADPVTTFSVLPNDASALIRYKNGTVEKKEFYYGSSFLSQSGRFFTISKDMESATLFDNGGNSRNILLHEKK